jgi:hypothetical protein
MLVLVKAIYLLSLEFRQRHVGNVSSRPKTCNTRLRSSVCCYNIMDRALKKEEFEGMIESLRPNHTNSHFESSQNLHVFQPSWAYMYHLG